jgi:DNA modification methylase
MKIMLGDCLEKLKKLNDNSIDAVVTDPPYGLSFMGKKWDYDVPSIEIWKEVLRVLKPGGHLLSFGGTRTYHRMVVNIEDAGFGSSLVDCAGILKRFPETTTSEEMVSVLGASRAVLKTLLEIKELGRSGNVHSTVKPIKLMEYLITLITPNNCTVLDPFMGSGSTGVAAVNKGFDFVGIEKEKGYFEIAHKRLLAAKEKGAADEATPLKSVVK